MNYPYVAYHYIYHFNDVFTYNNQLLPLNLLPDLQKRISLYKYIADWARKDDCYGLPRDSSDEVLANEFMRRRYENDKNSCHLPYEWNGNFGIYMIPLDWWNHQDDDPEEWQAQVRIRIDLSQLDPNWSCIKWFSFSDPTDIVHSNAIHQSYILTPTSFKKFMDEYSNYNIMKQLHNNKALLNSKSPQIVTYQDSIRFSNSDIENKK